MGTALLQKTLASPDPQALARAFRALPSLVRLDGSLMARDAYGILIRQLTRRDAERLQKALETEGIAAEAVDERTLIPLAHGNMLTRADALPEALVTYDSLQRPHPIEWSRIVLLAMGDVRQPVFRRIETERMIQAGMPGSHADVPIFVTDVSEREESVELPLLEIFADVAPARWRITPREFSYAYLGERMQRGLGKNFALFVEDLLRFAPHALLNRGFKAFRATPRRSFHYPNRHAFEEETLWLLWKARHRDSGP